MSPEDAGRSEFPELVPDHVLGDVDRNVAATIVDGNRVSNHFRKNRRTTAPSSEYDFISTAV
jgi:hypothetical protein